MGEGKNNKASHVWSKFFQMLYRSGLPYGWMLVAFVFNLAKAEMELLIPEKLAEVVVTLVPGENGVVAPDIVDTVAGMLMLLFAMGIFYVFCMLFTTVVQGIAQQKIDRNMQTQAVNKLFYLKVGTVEASDPRELVSRITTDTAQVSTLLLNLAINEIPRLYYMIAATVKLFTTSNPILAWTMLVTIPICFIGSFISGRLTFSRAEAVQGKIASLTARLAEKINNVSIIKSYNNEEKETVRGQKVIAELEKAKKQMTWIDYLNTLVKDMSGFLPVILIVVVGASLLLAGKIDIAAFTIFYGFANTFKTKAAEHVELWVAIKKAQGATYRLSTLLELEDEKEQKNGGIPDVGNIAFEDVTFCFGDKKVLDHASFEIEKGKKTAFVGYSGSGKSTALNLIEGFYQPTEGRITIGGKDIRDFDIQKYRSLFTYVPQNAPGFSGNLKELMSYGYEQEIDEKELKGWIEKAGLTTTVDMLGGLDYEVGTAAEKLSGGQKQKFSIVRGMLSDTEYMLLDEATSALDVNATKQFQQMIDEKMQGRTQILVAHDLSTVKNADKIIVFAKGEIVAQGTHKELLKSSRQYVELVQNLTGGERHEAV